MDVVYSQQEEAIPMRNDKPIEKVVIPKLKRGYNFSNLTNAVLQNLQGQPDQGQQNSGSQSSGQGNTSQQTQQTDSGGGNSSSSQQK